MPTSMKKLNSCKNLSEKELEAKRNLASSIITATLKEHTSSKIIKRTYTAPTSLGATATATTAALDGGAKDNSTKSTRSTRSMKSTRMSDSHPHLAFDAADEVAAHVAASASALDSTSHFAPAPGSPSSCSTVASVKRSNGYGNGKIHPEG